MLNRIDMAARIMDSLLEKSLQTLPTSKQATVVAREGRTQNLIRTFNRKACMGGIPDKRFPSCGPSLEHSAAGDAEGRGKC